MRNLLIGVVMLCCAVTSAVAQLSIGIGLPGVNIGINLPLYPELVPVPGYPVYYAPQLNSNFFFYDGMYWVYQGDNWYASTWYNGPWGLVGPQAVPLYVLRIPVRYYRAPPTYFHGWRSDAPPRWNEHWGKDWEQQRKGWDQWDRHSAPKPAPLPAYQRQYSGDRYPRQVEQQHALQSQNYRYQPSDPVVRQHYQEQPAQRAPASAQREQAPAPQDRGSKPQEVQHPSSQQRTDEHVKGSAPPQAAAEQRGPARADQKQEPHPGSAQHEQQAPAPRQKDMPQGTGASQRESTPGQGQGKDHDKGEERGQEHK